MTVIYIILYELYFEEAKRNKVYLYHYAMNIGINLIKQFFLYESVLIYSIFVNKSEVIS